MSEAEEDLTLMQFDRATLNLFGLRANPFLNDVESDDDVFRHHGYESVATAIKDAIDQRGFLAVIAHSGAGKTTIWDSVESELLNDEGVVICKPQLKSRDALAPQHLVHALICGLLGEHTRVPSNGEQSGRMLSRALRDARNGTTDRKVVLVIDDAHFCTTSVLRQLKTFYEEKVGRFRLMSIILIGLPALKEKLSLFEEIGNRIRLAEVPPVPVREYLQAKLARVNSSIEKIFEPDAFEAFCQRFKVDRKPPLGRPLIINAACIRAMVRTYENGAQPGERISRVIIDSLPGAPTLRRTA
jgi:type II secretory pathway predicted ATPase ExeA